ncbi:MAG: DUF1772 domain-containing protein [Pseudomonadales bacterium]|nr:DUF1772 domain-containing protein [Pseudomonadales bacterium]
MTIITLKLLILIPASVFTGVVLFLATVFSKSTVDMNSNNYHVLFTNIIRNGRKSILINSIVLLPLIGLVALVLIAGLSDLVFLGGAICFIFGSFVLSRAVNEPIYNQLLSTDPENNDEIGVIRYKLNRSNGLRALFSLLGVLAMGLSYVA